MTETTPSFEDMPDDPMAVHEWLVHEGRLDALRGHMSLSRIIGETLPLEPAEHGEMRGTCPDPDHDDGQRAFFVNDQRGVFHCFGCGLHGDVIRWMTDNRDMEYIAAVKHLIRLAVLDPD